MRRPTQLAAGCALLGLLGSASPPARAQVAPYRIAEADLAITGLSAEVENARPAVPRNVPSGVRVVVKAGGQVLSAEDLARFLGTSFVVRADLTGPGLAQAVRLPQATDPPSEDPLLLRLPPLSRSGEYTISSLRIVAAGRAVLDVAPRQVPLNVFEQILITSVQTRPLTLQEIQDKGILVDQEAYLGFEFTIGVLLESTPVNVRMPVVFDRSGVPTPPTIPLPVMPVRRGVWAPLPSVVPVLLRPELAAGDGGGGGGGGGGLDAGGVRIPSLLVIPGNVGYLRQHFSAQLFVANGAPLGSGLSVRNVTGRIFLPPGEDASPGTEDDPLILAPLVSGPPSAVLPVRGVGPDGEPGTADDVAVLEPAAMGQAEFLLRGQKEGFHNLRFQIDAQLQGLPTGPLAITGEAKGGVLVRNALFDMSFTVPSIVRAQERFKLVATVTNISRSPANNVSVTLDQGRMSGATLYCATPPCSGTIQIPFLAPGDARIVEFELNSQRTGQVVASYLRFDTGGTGRLNFTLGVGERGVPLSPDTLILPTSVSSLPTPVVNAVMRVLGQAWSVAQAPPDRPMPPSVLPIEPSVVMQKAVALSEAGLRVQLGQAVPDAVRDLAHDLYGGDPLDAGFDQLLRQTEAGHELALRLGAALEGAVTTAGGPVAYERASSEVAAAGKDFVAFAVRGTTAPVQVSLLDASGRRTDLGRSATDLPPSAVPGAVLLPAGAPASAPTLGLLTAPTMAPYTLEVSGPAELSVTFPRGDGTFQRGTLTTAHRARVVMDFDQPQTVAALEDADADGTFETRRDLARETLTSQGPRLVAAVLVGPETVDGATALGTNAAFLFDRTVSEESASVEEHFLVSGTPVLVSKRQFSGRLVFAGLAQPEGPYQSATTSVSGLTDQRGVAGPTATLPLVSRIEDPGAVVSGRVVNADGTPFTGGLVYYTNGAYDPTCHVGGFSRVAAVRPAADGRYEFRYVRRDHCGGPFEMAIYDPVTAAERKARVFVRTAGEQIVVDLALLGRGTVSGVVRTADGQPVGGAQVLALSLTDPTVGGNDTTDGDGRYSIPDLTVGGVNVRAVSGIYVGQAAGRIDRAGTTATVDVRLEGGSARMSGRVLRLEGGQTTPVPGAYVLYSLTGVPGNLGVAQTDATGRWVLQGMPAGNFTLNAYINTRDKAQITGHADEGQVLENLDLVVVIPPETTFGTVRGTVRMPSGAPAAGAVVYALDRGVLTAADGTYEITGLAIPSNPTVWARTRDAQQRTGYAHALLSTPHPVATGIDITLSGRGNLEFTVLDPTGQPLPGVPVALLGGCPNPCGCGQRVTDVSGRARFEGVGLGSTVTALAKRTVDGRIDVAGGSARVDQDGLTGYGIMRFGGFGTVRGTVLREGTTTPVHGAQVTLWSNRFDPEQCGLTQATTYTVRTDVSGQFDFPVVYAGPATARASQEFTTARASAGGTVSHGSVLNLTLTLRDTMVGGLSGTVFLPDGVTPAGPDVEVTVSGPLPAITVRTDAEGRYEFPEILIEGYYTMTVRDADTGGLAQQWLYLRAGQDAVHDVRLLGRGAVEVTVADGGDQVVEQATVRLQQTEYPYRVYDGVVQPATQGLVRFENVFEGPFTVSASDVFGRGGRASGRIGRPDETIPVRVRLTVTGAVRGRFLMPGGEPIPFGTVRLTAGGRVIGQVTTQAAGEVGFFAFDYVPAGQVRLDAQDPATARTGLAVGALETEGQVVTLDVRAQALGTVRGLVTGDGSPQPGALVEIVSGTYRVNTAADSEGWYQVPGVPEGRINVTASLEGGYLKATTAGTLAGEGSTLQLDVALRPSGEVRGHVTEADGVTPAVTEVRLTVGGIGGGSFAHHTPPEDGAFDFLRVPAGQGSLSVDDLGSIDQAHGTVDVPAGGVAEVALRLNGVGSLRGRALASTGQPTGGYLTLVGSGTYRWSAVFQLGPDGFYFMPQVMAGPFTASLRTQSGGFTLYGTASGVIAPDQETELDVQVQPSGTVTGLVLRAGGGAPAFGALVTLLHEKGTVHAQSQGDGRFEFRGVPLGTFSLTVFDEITTGHATVRGQQVAGNGQTVNVGTLVLDAVAPSLAVVEPVDGSTRPAIGGTLVVNLSDADSGIDTTSLRVLYPYGMYGSVQDASLFTFAGGQAQGPLRLDWLVVGVNRLRVQIKDLAGNLSETALTYTATGATLRGRVRRPDGTPAPGVNVEVGSLAPVTTAADGSYVKTGLRPANHMVRVVDPVTGVASGYGSYAQLFDGEDRTLDLTLPASGFIRGIVRYAGGAAAPGVTVSMWGRPPATTDASGQFDLGAFAFGSYTFSASDARGDRGVGAATITAAGQVAYSEIRLNGVGTVTVTVRDSSGAPVPNALVKASSSSPLGWATIEYTADGSGTRTFTQALAGTITAGARDPVRNLAGQASALLNDNGTLSLTVTLQPAGTVTGTVFRAGGTVPAPGMNVSITGASSITVVSDAQGHFTFPNVRLDAFTLVARDPVTGDFSPNATGLLSTPGQTATVNLTLKGVGSVRVIVRKGTGSLVTGANVNLTSSGGGTGGYGPTGADGSITFPYVVAGQLTIAVGLGSSLTRGDATATLSPGQSLELTVTLEPTGILRGHVFQADGSTPAAGVQLVIYAYYFGYTFPLYATSDAQGAYEFPEVPLRTYRITAYLDGRPRAYSPDVVFTTPGQVREVDLVLVGLGTVRGIVTAPGGAPAPGASITLNSTVYPFGGYQSTTSAADGSYQVTNVPMGTFTVSATRFAQGQRADATGEVSQHGQTVTVDLPLLANAVTLPLGLTDANSLSWYVQQDGSVQGAQVVGYPRRAPQLSLVREGTTYPFVGSGVSARTEENQRQVVIQQTGLAGLTVTRKAFVALDGYFLRYLDVLENPGPAPVTVDLVEDAALGNPNQEVSVVGTASGDAVLEPSDDWVVLDDANSLDIYTSGMWEQAPLGVVLSAATGQRPQLVAFDAGTHKLTYRWNGIVVGPGQRVAFLHAYTPQADRARASASAARLAQVPPELLVGLTPAEAAAIRNLYVPADLVSSLPPLPPNEGIVLGRVLAGDGVTPVKAAYVTYRSRSPHYGRPISANYSTAADGSFWVEHNFTAGYVKVVPRTDFDLTASLQDFGTMTATGSGLFPQTGVRDLSGVVGRSFVTSSTYGHACCVPENATDGRLDTFWQVNSGDTTQPPYYRTPFFEVVLPAEATVHEIRVRSRQDNGTYSLIRRGRLDIRDAAGTLLWSGDADFSADLGAGDVPVPAVAGARRVRLTVLIDGGHPSLAEFQVIGVSPLGPSRHAEAAVVFTGRGLIEGRVKRSDGSAIANVMVKLVGTPAQQPYVHSDAQGFFRHQVVPPGSFSIVASHPLGSHSVTVPGVSVLADQKTVQDVVFTNLGGLNGSYLSATGQAVNGSTTVTAPSFSRYVSGGTTFTFPDLPAGTYTVASSDYRSPATVVQTVEVPADTVVTRNATFPPVGTAVVTATVGGQPLYNAQVYWRCDVCGSAWISAGVTNGAGQRTITNVTGPAFTVKVLYPGNVNSIGLADATVPSEGATVPVSVAVPGVGSVTGTVLSRNGVPQGSATVRAFQAATGAELATATANAVGQFTLANVAVGPIRLRSEQMLAYANYNVYDYAEVSGALAGHGSTLALDALAPRGVLASPGQRDVWEYTLEAGQPGDFQVIGFTVGSAPALSDPAVEVFGPSGALVAANDDRSGTDKNPEVTFTAPASGVYLVVVRASAAQTGGYRMGSGGSNTRVFRRYAGTSVTGLVTQQTGGAPVSGATVRLTTSHPSGLAGGGTFVTAADGRYRFESVPSGSSLTVELLDGAGTLLARVTGTSGAAGSTAELPVTRPDLGQVEVLVTYRGTPFAGVAVQLQSDNPFATPNLTAQAGTSGADGRVLLALVPSGSISVHATDPLTGLPLEVTGALAGGALLHLDLVIPDSGDTTPPGTITDLAATSPAIGTIRLTWTAPGDDGFAGTAEVYALRYSTAPITEANFAGALVLPAPTPAAGGSVQTFDLTGLTSGSTFYFALKARDEALNWSTVSNSAQGNTGTLPGTGLKLWLKSDVGVTLAGGSFVSAWADQSGNNNHATQATASAQPTLVPGALNGLPVLRFDGSADWLAFTSRITNVRTAFWVVREDPTAAGHYRYLLGDTGGYPWCGGASHQIWSSAYTHANVTNGETRINGALVNGTTTNRPTSMSIVSVVTAADVPAASFARDPGATLNSWLGDLAELILYDRVLNDAERNAVEAYLAHRYALYVPTLNAPSIVPNGGTLSGTATVTISGKGDLHYTLDGTDPNEDSELYTEALSVSGRTTVKARAYGGGWNPSPVATATFLAQGDFSPASVSGLRFWVRADAGVSGGAAGRSERWADQSSQVNDLIQTDFTKQPLLVPNVVGGLPALRFDGTDDFMSLATRITNARTVFWVVREGLTTPGSYRYLLGDTGGYPWCGGASHQIWSSAYTHANVRTGTTRVNGAVVNGTTANRPTAMSIVSVVTNGDVPAASFSRDPGTTLNSWWGDLAELVIYDTALLDPDRHAVEAYLAARYGITLP